MSQSQDDFAGVKSKQLIRYNFFLKEIFINIFSSWILMTRLSREVKILPTSFVDIDHVDKNLDFDEDNDNGDILDAIDDDQTLSAPPEIQARLPCCKCGTSSRLPPW